MLLCKASNNNVIKTAMKMNSMKCRTCLAEKKTFINIFNEKDSMLWSNKIMSLANVKIYPNDGLPDIICVDCLKKLKCCLEFIEQCKKSDLELRHTELSSQVEENIIKSSSINNLSNIFNENIILSDCLVSKNETKQLKIETDCFMIAENNSKIKSRKRNSQKHVCSVCGKMMSSRYRLKTHLATHLEERPFSCQYCEKKFSTFQNVTVHQRTHTGEKPLECSVCGEKFAQSSGLTAHKRKHNGLMPYQCVMCPRSFRTIGHLQYHIRVHTGEKQFECGSCSRAFITRFDLKAHQLSHTGEKPHVCSICGMGLSRASNLRRHIQYAHEKEKLFLCLKCPSKFSLKSELNRHINKHEEKINDS